MPFRPPVHRPVGWTPARRVRTDEIDRGYGTQRWRDAAKAVIRAARGICALCGEPGADLCDHVVPKRLGGSDHPSNLRAVHRACHNRRHHGHPPRGG